MGFLTDRVQCYKCDLGRHRETVLPTGLNGERRLAFVGEAPGVDADRRGEPFVGAPNSILTKLLGVLELSRDQVIVTHVCKCRPPSDRDPYDDEYTTCLHEWLIHELTMRSEMPLVIPLGELAATVFLGARPIHNVAGRAWSTEYLTGTLWDSLVPWGAPVLRVYPLLHPALISESGLDERRFWSDVSRLRIVLKKWAHK